MKHLLILSGKGGTGKTTIASSFIKLSHAKAYADCDVDAPNLHLVMGNNDIPIKSNYFGLPKAKIDPNLCLQCGLCIKHCRFDAIDNLYQIDLFACEGCGVCKIICPNHAISFFDDVAGDLMLYIEDKIFSTAELKMGSGTSGKLVSKVKEQLKSACDDIKLVIIDGSPGIGCPVIASLSGVDMVLIVAEPSISGFSDMERIFKTSVQFHIKIAICINKYDTNMEKTKEIEDFCFTNKIHFVGQIPFDYNIMDIINLGKCVVDEECIAKDAIIEVYKKTIEILFN